MVDNNIFILNHKSIAPSVVDIYLVMATITWAQTTVTYLLDNILPRLAKTRLSKLLDSWFLKDTQASAAGTDLKNEIKKLY